MQSFCSPLDPKLNMKWPSFENTCTSNVKVHQLLLLLWPPWCCGCGSLTRWCCRGSWWRRSAAPPAGPAQSPGSRTWSPGGRWAAAGGGVSCVPCYQYELAKDLSEVSQCPEKSPTRAFSLLKAPTKNIFRHFYAEKAFKHSKLGRFTTRIITNGRFG